MKPLRAKLKGYDRLSSLELKLGGQWFWHFGQNISLSVLQTEDAEQAQAALTDAVAAEWKRHKSIRDETDD